MSWRVLPIAIAVAICACASTPRRPRTPGDEYLAAIRIEGNSAVDSDALIRGLALHRAQQGGRGLDEYQLSLDVQRIESAYQRRGYLNVRVEPRVERAGDAATLIFTVTEGPRARATVEISGLPPEVSASEARATVGVADGSAFDYDRYDLAKLPLLALVENAGYAHAQLDASVLADPPHNRATLRYAFDPGPRVHIGAVEVIGTSGDLADAVRRRATLAPGDVYSTKAVTDTQLAIYGMGRFTSVRVDVDRDSLASTVPVKITVVEAKQNEARAGGGAALDSSTYQVRARGSLSHKGWITPLTTMGVDGIVALTALRDDCLWYEVQDCELDPLVRLLGTLSQQDLFVRGLNGQLQGGLDYLALEAYTVTGARLNASVDLPLLVQRFHATIGWQLVGYDFSKVDSAIDDATARRLGIDHFERVGAFTEGVSIDYRDDPIEPHLGAYGELKLSEAAAFTGSAYDYVQITPDVRGYIPLGRVVLAARARYGVFHGDLPPTERYYGGGASSHRGFAERRLSPLARSIDADGDEHSVVIGGIASFQTGLEARTSFEPSWLWKIGFVAFLDGGDVTESADELALDHLHWAVGAGIRPFFLPVGPLRFDVAYRLNRTGPGEPSEGHHWNWHISLGETF